MTLQLTRFDAAKRAIELAASVDEVKEIRDKAEAIRLYMKQSGESLEMQNQAAEIGLRASRRMGEMLAEMNLNGGDRKSDYQSGKVKLADIGMSGNQSSRCQRIAAIPQNRFDEFIETTKAKNKELTKSAALKLAKQLLAQDEVRPDPVLHEDTSDSLEYFINTGVKFGCIYADPAWQYGNQGTRASTDNHYKTMPLDEICALPIEQIASDSAHLHLWTTNAFLFDAKRVMEAWGFEYKSVMVWVKPQMGIGNYWRVSHEFLLLGVRGETQFRDHGIMSWVEAKRERHSSKPEVFRSLIERVSDGPYIELFSRNMHPGWSSWGNQVSPHIFCQGDTDDNATVC